MLATQFGVGRVTTRISDREARGQAAACISLPSPEDMFAFVGLFLSLSIWEAWGALQFSHIHVP